MDKNKQNRNKLDKLKNNSKDELYGLDARESLQSMEYAITENRYFKDTHQNMNE